MPNLIDPALDLTEYLHTVGMLEAQSIRPPSDFYQSVMDRRHGAGSAEGESLPWDSGYFFQFRPGEVTVWAGYNFHGKSRIAGQVCSWLMRTSRHCVASLEMPAQATLDRMVSQCSGSENYSDKYLAMWLDWADDRLWLYDVQERTEAERLLGLVYYCAKELQIQHVWIDSLMQTKLSGDQRNKYSEQADFVDDLCRAAKATGCHVHLVMHLRKPEGVGGEEKIPDRYSARGAAELVDRPDNVIVIHRNVRKFRLKEKDDCPDDIDSYRDGTFRIDKQRHHRGKGGTGDLKMYESPGGGWNDSKSAYRWPIDLYKAKTIQSVETYLRNQ